MLTEEQKRLVEMRLRMLPKDIKIHILGRAFTVDQLIKEVQKGTEIGEYIAQQQLNYLKYFSK